jgi:radical SAM superfamily enzyme YgiQ (UPF0313 family)
MINNLLINMEGEMFKKKVIIMQLMAPVQSSNATTGIFVPLALGLLKAQAMQAKLCPEHFDIEILDRKKCLNYGEKRLINYILDQRPYAIAFSCYVWNILRSQFVTCEIKKRLPGVKIIFGGPEVGARCRELMEETAEIDVAIKGEGEEAFVEILESYLGRRSLSEIKGIGYRQGMDQIIETEDRSIVMELDKIASPYLYNVFNLKDYDEIVFETSRGCPFNCSYCYYGGGNKSVRYFSLDRIRDELWSIRRQGGARNIEFTDSNINLPKRLLALYPVIKEVNHDHYFKFRVEVNPEFVTEDQIRIFKELNMYEIEVGIQSTDINELKAVHRSFSEEKVSRCIQLLKASGLMMNFHLIMGLPYQTIESFKKSNQFLIDQGVGDKVNNFLLKVLPGTDLRKRAESLGLKYSKYPPYVIESTATLSPKDLAHMIDLRSEYIRSEQNYKAVYDEEQKQIGYEIQYHSNFELLRYNSYLNTDYRNLDIESKEYRDFSFNTFCNDLGSKILSRIVILEDFLKKDLNVENVNGVLGVFNQIVVYLGNKDTQMIRVCEILMQIFKDNPYVCTDIVFHGDCLLNDNDVYLIFKAFSKVFKSYKYVELERTRKRIELIAVFTMEDIEPNKVNMLSKQIVPIVKIPLAVSINLHDTIEKCLNNGVKGFLFETGNVVSWKQIYDWLDIIYQYNVKNYYVFFSNITVQQYYLRNFVYEGFINKAFTRYPFGYHDGELTLICGEKLEFICAKDYPFG